MGVNGAVSGTVAAHADGRGLEETHGKRRNLRYFGCPAWNAGREMWHVPANDRVNLLGGRDEHPGAATTTCGKVMSTTVSGNTVTVQLGNVNCDGSDITVTVTGVNGASGSVDASATMTLRVADVNADGFVDTADINEIRMHIGRGLVNDSNFRDDITVDGHVNHGDKTLAKTKL